MSTITQQQAQQRDGVITYVPLGEESPITLTVALAKRFLIVPTKSGALPTDEQITKYLMLCKARSLNPWENDAYLVGYDSKDGPSFSLITAHQAFLKRAEASPEFDGMESGVIVLNAGKTIERQGDLIVDGEILIGGWARVHRRDRAHPSFDSLNLRVYNTNRSRWAADPAGMIVKCAEASALRKAFPSSLAAMYCREEMEHRDYPERQAGRLTTALTESARPRIAQAAPSVTSTIVATQPEAVPPPREEPPAAPPERKRHEPSTLALWADYLTAEHGRTLSAADRAELEAWEPDRLSRAVKFSMQNGIGEITEPDA